MDHRISLEAALGRHGSLTSSARLDDVCCETGLGRDVVGKVAEDVASVQGVHCLAECKLIGTGTGVIPLLGLGIRVGKGG